MRAVTEGRFKVTVTELRDGTGPGVREPGVKMTLPSCPVCTSGRELWGRSVLLQDLQWELSLRQLGEGSKVQNGCEALTTGSKE